MSGDSPGPTGDGSAERIGIGPYLIRFNHDAIDCGTAGCTNPRWLHDCAIIATPRESLVFCPAGVGRHVSVQPAGVSSAVIVSANEPGYQFGRSVLRDTPLGIAAIC